MSSKRRGERIYITGLSETTQKVLQELYDSVEELCEGEPTAMQHIIDLRENGFSSREKAVPALRQIVEALEIYERDPRQGHVLAQAARGAKTIMEQGSPTPQMQEIWHRDMLAGAVWDIKAQARIAGIDLDTPGRDKRR